MARTVAGDGEGAGCDGEDGGGDGEGGARVLARAVAAFACEGIR